MIFKLSKISWMLVLILYLFPILLYSQNINDPILAKVGNHKITISDFDERYSNYLYSTGIKDNLAARESILNNMINEILLYHYDDNSNIITHENYLKELAENRIRIILAYLKDQEIHAKISVSKEEMREAFSRVNEEIAARHLFSKTEEEAYNLYGLAKIGVDFETLAKQVFTDSVLQNNGGYLGYFTWGDMDPAFEDVAYSLEIGEISAPVKTAYGYSIIKLEDRIINPLLTESEFQRKKTHLENVIKMRKKEPSEEEYLKSIFDESKLTFNDVVLERILVEIQPEKILDSENNAAQREECVKYRDKVYNQLEIEQKISELPSYQKNRINSIESLKAAIEGLLIKDTLFSIAVEKGYDTTKVVLDKIEKYEMNIFFKYKKDEIISDAKLPDSLVFKFYNDNISLYSTEPELNLQEILVEDEELADSIIRLLHEGNDFGELAKKYSLRKWSAENNGIMGFTSISKFGNYKNLFWNSYLGAIIGPIKIENIFGIFKVLGKKESEPIDYDEIIEEVTNGCKLESQMDILNNYLTQIRNKVSISVNEDVLNFYEVAEF